jgi:uncharacterized protein YecT (DUF1311 family)
MRVFSGLVPLPIVLACSGALAVPVQIAHADCSGSGGNVGYKDCLCRNYEAADAYLNRVYRQVKAELGAEQRGLLTDAQLDCWDNGGEFEASESRGGTG